MALQTVSQLLCDAHNSVLQPDLCALPDAWTCLPTRLLTHLTPPRVLRLPTINNLGKKACEGP